LDGNTTHVSLCRPGSEPWLAAELRAAGATPLSAQAAVPGSGTGWLAWQPAAQPAARPGSKLPGLTGKRAPIFERQRMAGAVWLPGSDLDALAPQLTAAARQALARLGAPAALALHAFAPDPTGERSGSGRAARLERLLRTAWNTAWSTARDVAAPPLLPMEPVRAEAQAAVWQVCLLECGVWWSLTPAAGLADPYPGGVHRMARAAGAPSRSVLKLEEALEVLGRAPRARERVIDLGAAPGGWSYACLQRGCRVLAVDNGPLKLAGLDALPGELTHLRADGLRLRPPPGWLPADWLLSDMLIAPGVCLGLLRKWIEGGWMRRFVVNVKLPQREPLAALAPLCDFLAGVPGLAWRMRQLYHDRREVTVLGGFTAPRALREPRAAAQRPVPAPRTKPRAKPRGKPSAKARAKARAVGRPAAGRPAAAPARGQRPAPPRERRPNQRPTQRPVRRRARTRGA
jgi:hypothetical protein